MELRTPEINKLVKSALICIGAMGMFLLITFLFPNRDFNGLESGLIAIISAWLINTAKESLSL